MEAATTERLETKQQCEKDRVALLAQVKLLEAELEEQVSRHRACASQAEELCALRQQMVSLDKHLRSQRQFMDVSALYVLLASLEVIFIAWTFARSLNKLL